MIVCWGCLDGEGDGRCRECFVDLGNWSFGEYVVCVGEIAAAA